MINEKFQEYKIRDLGSFRNGVNFKNDQKGVESLKSFSLINVKDIFSGGRYLDFESMDSVALPDLKNIDRYVVQKSDLFFVRSSVKRDGIALVSMARSSQSHAVHCGFVIRFRLESEVADPLFLVYLLRDTQYREELKNLSGGAAITNISQDGLGSLSVFLPILPTQRKIALILSAYDDLIENNTRRIAILEEMAQAIYREWFVNFRFPGHENVKLVQSTSGMIPEGWELKCLSELGFIGRGKSRHRPRNAPELYGGPYPLFQTGDIKAASTFLWKHTQTYSEAGLAQSKLWEPGTLCITIAANIAETAILSKTACFPDSVVGFVSNPDEQCVYFVKLYLETIKSQVQNVSRGTTQDNLSLEKLLSFKVPTPPSKLLTEFHACVSPVFDNVLCLAKKNDNLRTTRDLLLPKLISGKLDVEDIDIDIDLGMTEEALEEATA